MSEQGTKGQRDRGTEGAAFGPTLDPLIPRSLDPSIVLRAEDVWTDLPKAECSLIRWMFSATLNPSSTN